MPQVAVHKQLLSQQGHEHGERPTDCSSQLQIFEQQHGDQRCPDLNFQRIGTGADEGRDPQGLFQSAKEHFNLPGFAIDVGDGASAEME